MSTQTSSESTQTSGNEQRGLSASGLPVGDTVSAEDGEGMPQLARLEDPTAVPTSTLEPAVVDPSEDPYLGQVIEGRYHLVKLIASSGMSRVYLASQPRLNREVAVKLLHMRDGGADVEMFRRRFTREASAMARLNHPNIVRVFDHGTFNGIPYLVMEYIQGTTLRQYYKDNDIAPALALDIVDQVARALAEAHGNGIVHRDIKPANIFVSGDSTGDLVVRLVDFGIAKDSDDASELTGVDTVLGTPWYMAPEQAMGEEVDGRTDLYALGVLLYRLLTGRTPFSTLRGAAVLVAHINTPAPPFSEFVPDHKLHPVLEWTSLRCLEKNPDSRFRDVSELRKAIQVCRLALAQPDLEIELGLNDGMIEAPEEIAELLVGTQFLLTRRLKPVEQPKKKTPVWIWALPAALAALALLVVFSGGEPDAPAVPEPTMSAVSTQPVAAPAEPAAVVAAEPSPASVEEAPAAASPGTASPEPAVAAPPARPASTPPRETRPAPPRERTPPPPPRRTEPEPSSRRTTEPEPPAPEPEPVGTAEPPVPASTPPVAPASAGTATPPAAPANSLGDLSVDAVGGKVVFRGRFSEGSVRPLGYMLDGDGSVKYVIELPATANATGVSKIPLASDLASSVRIRSQGEKLVLTVDGGSNDWGLPTLKTTSDGFELTITAGD